MKYVYPAVFTPEGNDLYSVDFPDLHNYFTSGKGLPDAVSQISARSIVGRQDDITSVIVIMVF